MLRHILIACSILISLPVYSMKRLGEHKSTNHRCKKMCLDFSPSLPFEMRQLIIDSIIVSTYKLKPCIETIKSFVLTNNQSYNSFNDSKYNDNLIERLSKKFYCSHETVAKALSTPHAKNRLSLQTQLFNLCLKKGRSHHIIKSKFDQLIEQGVNVDFTYEYNYRPQTLLMIQQSTKMRSRCFDLLKEKANFNQQTQHHKTLLMQALEYPISPNSAKAIIQHKKIEINAQNYREETALLYTIKNRAKYFITTIFVNTIENLLLHGANPLIADRFGNTPLKAAYEIPDQSEMKDIVIELLSRSIAEHQKASEAHPQ